MKSKILVIDDELSIRMLLENFLSKHYEVITTANGSEAIEWLSINLPDVIICDIQMPGMDGYHFLEYVRNNSYTSHTPVIMLSGIDTSKDRVKCYRMGSQDFLVKPFNPEELEELIKKNLNPIHYAVKW